MWPLIASIIQNRYSNAGLATPLRSIVVEQYSIFSQKSTVSISYRVVSYPRLHCMHIASYWKLVFTVILHTHAYPHSKKRCVGPTQQFVNKALAKKCLMHFTKSSKKQ